MNLATNHLYKTVLLICLLLGAITSAQAVPIHYSVDLVIEEWYDFNGNAIAPVPGITASPLIFNVDSSLLASDGLAKAAKPSNAYIRIGDTVWAQDFASDLDGFRGPCYNPYYTCTPSEVDVWGLDSEYWGFDVTAGKLTGIWGGVYGVSDFPFVDFMGDKFSSSFYAYSSNNPQGVPKKVGYNVKGSWRINRISEPAVLLLLVCGIPLFRVRRGIR